MANRFTDQQLAVIDNRGGDLLVSAAAGSGKTTVLVERIMGYLQDGENPANLDDFLMITYTKAAAAELREKIANRLVSLIGEQPENIHLRRQMQRLYLAGISTVHAFCGDLLRQYAYRVDVPMDFRIGDENECFQLRMETAQAVLSQAYSHVDEDFIAFSDTQAMGRTDASVPEIIMKIYDASRCHKNPDAWLQSCLANTVSMGQVDFAETPWGSYLVADTQDFLSLQIPVMEKYVALCDTIAEYGKPSAVLREELQSMYRLQNSREWDEYVENIRFSFGVLRFPSKDPAPEISSQIKALRNALKKRLETYQDYFSESSAEIMADAASQQAAARGLIHLVREFSKAYDEAKKKRRILDYSDLEHRTLDLVLGKHRDGITKLAREIGSRYREILVDEYQDSNEVQDSIFAAITAGRNHLFMVGDVKQSIYRFRLADPNIFLGKYNTYAPAAESSPGQPRKILLSRNFRSGTGVISAVNDVFSYCMSKSVGGLTYGEEEALVEGIPHSGIGEAEVELHVLNVEESAYAEEADFVVERIVQLLDGSHSVRDGDRLRPIRPEDIAILLRSPGTMGRYYEEAMSRRGIRCDSGGGTDLLKTEEVSAIRALLQCISNPRQDIALIGVLASPLFGFTADDLAVIRKGSKHVPFYNSMQECGMEKAKDFIEKLKKLRKTARTTNLSELLAQVYTTLRPESIFRLRENGEAKAANLQSFYQIAVQYENGGKRDLDQFLRYLDLMEEKGLKIEDSGAGTGCVRILSIHKSKGLEYPVVFLSGLSKAFNQDSSRGRVLCDRELGIGLTVMDQEHLVTYPSLAKQAIAIKERSESRSEELRILYVGMTRARDRLIMTHSMKNPEKKISEWLEQIPMEDPRLLCRFVNSMGQWVILTALQHTEAGELFSLGSRKHETYLGNPPWKITVAEKTQTEERILTEDAVRTGMPDNAIERIREGLTFVYPHVEATVVPSKKTATEQKGRHKDEEAAEHSESSAVYGAKWRKPGKSVLRGKDRGNAMHRTMQYLDFASCDSVQSVQGQIDELTERGILTSEQSKSVSASQIAAFFASDLGKRVQQAGQVIREFKFSLLMGGEPSNPELADEKILMQGVVDCAILEEDGIVLLDFKTDRAENLASRVEIYRGQVNTYAEALEKIYEKPVKEKYLYFFHSGQAVQIC